MKKYAFPFTLSLVCFVGGYTLNLGERDWLKAQLDSTRIAYGELVGWYEKRVVAVVNVRRENDSLQTPPALKDWNQGLIAPMIPPKLAAP